MRTKAFYRGKRIFVTGHTGFKGAWLCRLLLEWGAEVYGYALHPPSEPNLYTLAGLEGQMASYIGDIRDLEYLRQAMQQVQPQIVFHLAAQPIVQEGYRDPVSTYSTNVMGAVHVLECVRHTDTVQSVIHVTTDKVYDNQEWCWPYRETDRLDGYDPYSNSKSCAELVTHSYIRSFLYEKGVRVSTLRAGNVIGGGDFAAGRIVPDCIRSVCAGHPIQVRNPASIRPYQHVLEPLAAYVLTAQRQWEDPALAGCYNVGPDTADSLTTGELVEMFCTCWGEGASWQHQADAQAPHEAGRLRLDCTKIQDCLGWKPRWNIRQAIQQTVCWAKVWQAGQDIPAEMQREIQQYFA